MEKMRTLKSIEEVQAMSGQERVEFFRGAVSDYGDRVKATFFANFEGDVEIEPEIAKVFQMRVESNLAEPGIAFGGQALDHLPQGESPVITQGQYDRLNEAAVALAANILEEVGYGMLASRAYEQLGKLSAKHYLRKED